MFFFAQYLCFTDVLLSIIFCTACRSFEWRNSSCEMHTVIAANSLLSSANWFWTHVRAFHKTNGGGLQRRKLVPLCYLLLVMSAKEWLLLCEIITKLSLHIRAAVLCFMCDLRGKPPICALARNVSGVWCSDDECNTQLIPEDGQMRGLWTQRDHRCCSL